MTHNLYFPLNIIHHCPEHFSKPASHPEVLIHFTAWLVLGTGFADPVVLVNPRPGKGEGGPVGLEYFLAGKLGAWTSSWSGMRWWEHFPSEGLPLLPQPGLWRTR